MSLIGQVRVLTDNDMQRVHDSACRILSEKGMVFEDPEVRDFLTLHGCTESGKYIRFPKALVEKCIAQCPSTFLLEAMDPKYNVTVGGDQILVNPAGGQVTILDHDGTRRSATMKDFDNMQIIYQNLENVNMGGYQPLSPVDVPKRYNGLYLVRNSMQHCSKPILGTMDLDTIDKKNEVIQLFNVAYGSENYIDNHYLTWISVCPESPYMFPKNVTDGIRIFAEHNQPANIVSAPMSGITSPIYLIQCVALSIAEMLAGLVYAQLLKPGLPVILSASLTYGNLRYATWECASPDSAFLLAATVQMQRYFYHLPARAQTGVTNAKINDYQAGMESMQSFLFTALAGANLTSQSSGSLGDLLIASLEKAVLDDELISRVRWMIDGMHLEDEEQWDFTELFDAEPGENFLTSDGTIDHMHDYWQPTTSDWGTMDHWDEDGMKNVEEIAHEKVVKILENAPESLLDPAQEKEMDAYIKSVVERG